MFTLSHAARAGASAIKMGIYSMLVGPGVMLISLLMLMPSVSQDFLISAEKLLRDAPADKVWTCSHVDGHRAALSGPPRALSEVTSLPEAKPVQCTPHLQSRSEWANASDKEIHHLYMRSVMLSGLFYGSLLLFRLRGGTRFGRAA